MTQMARRPKGAAVPLSVGGGVTGGGAKIRLSRILAPFLLFTVLLYSGLVARQYRGILLHDADPSGRKGDEPTAIGPNGKQTKNKLENKHTKEKQPEDEPSAAAARNSHAIANLPEGFVDVLYRAKEMAGRCRELQPPGEFRGFDNSSSVTYGPHRNETLAALPAFGIIDHIEKYVPDDNEDPKKWKCVKPNRKECTEETFSVVFMAYNPDRLKVTLDQIRMMLEDENWSKLVHECVIVWNGERELSESEIGNATLAYANHPDNALRIVYPLKMGLPNDLMNRYHPHVVQPQTKALLYYDDDGPFYSFEAIQAGFELWKRHSSAQVGAMSREISVGTRQAAERAELSPREDHDRLFVSHCDNVNDQVDYNFRYFANYDANMVLPSGSFLHSQYLCFLWHPVLEPVRHFVREHPVHPDDMTVSLVVSQIAGRAPRVYSRRLKKAESKKSKKKPGERRLLEVYDGPAKILGNAAGKDFEDDAELWSRKQHSGLESLLQDPPLNSAPIDGAAMSVPEQMRRKLLFNIEWDTDNQKMTDSKKMWAALRTEAVNSLVRYFGSLNSGSIGWCEGTEYYNPKVAGNCDPVMARIGWLPWMEADGSPKDECP